MNRKIKFRGLGENGQWYYGYYWALISVNPIVEKHYIRDGADHLVKKETVGQFTGLHDKNGKEIYEGDIVTWETVSLRPREVKFCDGAFYLKSGRIVNTFFSDNIRPEEELLIIGNIYQNPELL